LIIQIYLQDMLKNLLKILNRIFPISDFLYILQLEEYESKRYFNRLKRFFWRRNLEKRDKLVYTTRIKIILCLALPFILITPPFTPFWIGLSNLILTPYFSFIRLKIQKRASLYFSKVNTKTKIIAVAGSFGKTTTKNYIYELVKYNYKTQMIPGNINTPTGIANWIINNFNPTIEILIVEVDTYFIGEIKRSLKITPPDIAILTNVGDQHLERFKNKSNLKKALYEVFDYSKPKATKIQNKKTNLEYALEVAKILKIPDDIIKDTVKKLKPPERRGNITKLNDFDLIDNSYNISETTGIKSVKNAKEISDRLHKKLIVMTAGIPELGDENKNGNINLGRVLGKKADVILLLQSIFSKDVEKGISKNKKIIKLEFMRDALDKLKEFDSKKYIILMQPELNDLYY